MRLAISCTRVCSFQNLNLMFVVCCMLSVVGCRFVQFHRTFQTGSSQNQEAFLPCSNSKFRFVLHRDLALASCLLLATVRPTRRGKKGAPRRNGKQRLQTGLLCALSRPCDCVSPSSENRLLWVSLIIMAFFGAWWARASDYCTSWRPLGGVMPADRTGSSSAEGADSGEEDAIDGSYGGGDRTLHQPSAGPPCPTDSMATRGGQDVATTMTSNRSASSRRRATSLEATGTSPVSNMLTAGRTIPRTTPSGFGASKPVPRAALKKGLNPASALDRVDLPKTYASGRVSAPRENVCTPIFGSSTTTARGRMAPTADAPSTATRTRPASGPSTLTAGPQRVKHRPAPPSLVNVQRESESAAGVGIGIRGRVGGRVGGEGRGGGRVVVKKTEKALATSVAAAGRASALAQKASEEVAAARKANDVAGTKVVDLTSAAFLAEQQALKTRGQALVSRATEGAPAKGEEESMLARKVLPLKSATEAAGVEEAKEATLAARSALAVRAASRASKKEVMEARWRAKKAAVAAVAKAEAEVAEEAAAEAAVVALRATAEMIAAKKASKAARERVRELTAAALAARREGLGARGQALPSRAAAGKVGEGGEEAGASRKALVAGAGSRMAAELEEVATATRETWPLNNAAVASGADEKEVTVATRPALALRAVSGSTKTDGTTTRISEETAVAGVVAGAAGLAAARKVNEAARERASASTTAALVARRKALKATRHALVLGAAAAKWSDGGVKSLMTPKALAEGGMARAAAEVKDEGTATREALPLKAAATATGVDKKTEATMATRPALALRAASGSPKTEMTAATQEAKEAAAVAATGAAAAASSSAAGVAEARKATQEARERAVGIAAEPLAVGRESQVRRHALASRPAPEKTTEGGGERTVLRKTLVAGAVARAATGKHPEGSAPREALPLKATAGVVGAEEEKEEPVATRPTLALRSASRLSKKKVTTTRETREAAAGAAGAEAAALRAPAGTAADANRAVRERVRAVEAEAVAARREAMVARRQMLTSRSAAAMGPPLSAGLPPLPVGGTNHFAIGTAPAREQQGEDFVPPGQHGWVSPHVYLKPSVARVASAVATEEASVSTVAGGGATGAADAGVEEQKGEEATRQAEAAMRRAEEAATASAAAAAAAAAAATVVVAPPLPAGLPPLPRWGVNNFAIGTAAAKEQRGDDFVPPGQHGWVSPHVYLKPSVARVASAVAGGGAAGATEAGVEEEKGEEATRQAEVAIRRAEEAATAAAAGAAAAAAAAATVVVVPPLPIGLPPLPRWGVNNFTIGTESKKEQQGEDFVPPGQHGWVSPHVYLKPSVARMARTVATEEASVSTVAGAGAAGAADAGVEEQKGEEATRQAEAAMRRAEEAETAAAAKAAAAAAVAAAAAAATVVVAPPLPAGLPPLPRWGVNNFAIGTAFGREQRGDDFVPPGQHGWVSPHVYLKPSVARVARAVTTEEASVPTAAGRGEVAGAAEAGVAEGKGEEATRQAEAAVRRAEEAAAAVAAAGAAAAAAATAAAAPPLPAGLPPVPDWGLGHFEIGTAFGREQRGDAALLAPAGPRGWVSTHFYR